MGKSAKLTRGGNKKRVNVGRQEAKLKALQAAINEKNAKSSAKKDGSAAPKAANKKLVAERLRSQSQVSAVKMASKPAVETKKQQSTTEANEEAQQSAA